MRIHFKDMEPSPALIDDMERRGRKLTDVFPRIVDIKVHIEGLAHHHAPWRVTLDLVIPGAEVVTHGTHADPYVAVHEAFNSMKRELINRGQARVTARTDARTLNAARRAATAATEATAANEEALKA